MIQYSNFTTAMLEEAFHQGAEYKEPVSPAEMDKVRQREVDKDLGKTPSSAGWPKPRES